MLIPARANKRDRIVTWAIAILGVIIDNIIRRTENQYQLSRHQGIVFFLQELITVKSSLTYKILLLLLQTLVMLSKNRYVFLVHSRERGAMHPDR